MTQKLYIDQKSRIESGVVQFQYNDGYKDWPGLFLRGDNCFFYRCQLEKVIDYLTNGVEVEADLQLTLASLKSLLTDLQSTDVREGS